MTCGKYEWPGVCGAQSCGKYEWPGVCGAQPNDCLKKIDGASTGPVLTESSPTTPQNVETDSRLQIFDRQTRTVTEQRGAIYGPPSKDFDRVNRLQAVVAECRDPLARHALNMICVKIARLIETPDHLDSWIDTAGYARTGVMVTER